MLKRFMRSNMNPLRCNVEESDNMEKTSRKRRREKFRVFFSV